MTNKLRDQETVPNAGGGMETKLCGETGTPISSDLKLALESDVSPEKLVVVRRKGTRTVAFAANPIEHEIDRVNAKEHRKFLRKAGAIDQNVYGSSKERSHGRLLAELCVRLEKGQKAFVGDIKNAYKSADPRFIRSKEQKLGRLLLFSKTSEQKEDPSNFGASFKAFRVQRQGSSCWQVSYACNFVNVATM
jgi:hypothetical protein